MKIYGTQSDQLTKLFAARANPWAPKYEPELWNDCSQTAYEINLKRYAPVLDKLKMALGVKIDRPAALANILRSYTDDNLRLVTGKTEPEIAVMRRNFMHFLGSTCMSTNCIAYGLNIRHGFKPGDLLTPGYLDRIGAQCSVPIAGKDIGVVFDGFAKDGFEFFKGHPNHDRPPAGFYLMALLVHYDEKQSGRIKDIHGVRYDRDGRCSHKLGHEFASRSYLGKDLIDPTAPKAFGDYKYEGSLLVPAVLPQHSL